MNQDNEAKKQYLQGYARAVRQMERCELKIRELRLGTICPAIIADGMPHGTAQGDLSGYAATVDHEYHKYFKARYKRIKLCKEITDKIEQLADEDEKDVLMLRYIRLMKWEEICVEMRFSWKQIHRIHSRALNNFMMT